MYTAARLHRHTTVVEVGDRQCLVVLAACRLRISTSLTEADAARCKQNASKLPSGH